MRYEAIEANGRVLLLPATRRDAEVAGALFHDAGICCVVCPNVAALAAAINDDVGAVLLTDTALHDAHIDRLLEALKNQPPWSDLPVILLSSIVQSKRGVQVLQSLPNVTVLERPSSSRTLLSSTKAALRARARQYQLRDQFNILQDSEAALRRVSEGLKDTNRRKDEFLAMLAHELRNPLAPIRNASEILERRLPDESMKPMVNIVKRQVTQLARLVDDLLDVSRITEGRIDLRRAPVDVSSIVLQATESVEALVRQRKHTLLIGANYQSLWVEGDHARLVQSVANVLTNAAKYTDPGGEIRLEIQKWGDMVAIVVADNGPGISPQLLPRIFDLFVQGERTLDRSQGGLGIGLSIVKRLVEMHGGSVTAFSEGLGHGATFELCLPLIEAPISAERKLTAPTIAAKRILIVDDNVDAANSLAILLRLDGHETVALYRSADVIAQMKSLHPDVVILDIGLPGMDGYEVAKLIRKKYESVQLIALTGYGQAEDIKHALSVGFDGHVTKPADADALARMIGKFTRAEKLNSE